MCRYWEYFFPCMFRSSSSKLQFILFISCVCILNIHRSTLSVCINKNTHSNIGTPFYSDLFVMCVFYFELWNVSVVCARARNKVNNSKKKAFTWNMDDTTRHFNDFTTHLSTSKWLRRISLSPFPPLFLSLLLVFSLICWQTNTTHYKLHFNNCAQSNVANWECWTCVSNMNNFIRMCIHFSIRFTTHSLKQLI